MGRGLALGSHSLIGNHLFALSSSYSAVVVIYFFVFAFLRSPFIHVALDDALAIHLERVIFHLSCLYSNLTADESSLAQPLAIISLPVHTNLVVNDDEFR